MKPRPSTARLKLDDLNRALINRLQSPLPLAHRPFQIIAAELGSSEDEVIARTQAFLENGTLTRFGPFIDAEAMGGAFCLCAMSVPVERFEAVAQIVNAFAEVAHNYERDHVLNMWFVLATAAPEDVARVAKQIEAAARCPVHLFPKEQEYFIGFRVTA